MLRVEVKLFGGSGSAGDSQDAWRGAEPVDAGRGWQSVGGEVSQ